MEAHTVNDDARRMNRWRIAGWSLAGFLLLLPMVAMQFTDSVNWTTGDFIFAALLLLGIGVPIELVVRASNSNAYRAGAALALLSAFFMMWSNGAVGIIGSETADVNQFYLLLLALAVVASFAARFRAGGMAVVMAGTALVQAVFAAIAALAGWGAPQSNAVEIMAVNGFFIAMWAGSAALFHHAANAGEEAVD